MSQQAKTVTTEEAKTMKNKINIEGTIVNCKEPRDVNLKTGVQTKVMEAELEDAKGRVTVNFWGDDVQKVKNGSKVGLKNAYMKEYKGQQSLQTGQYGQLVVLQY